MTRIEIKDLAHDEQLDTAALEVVRGGLNFALGAGPHVAGITDGTSNTKGITDGTSNTRGIIAVLIGL